MRSRRQWPRRVPDRILSIRIEPDHNAIVLNTSEGGLGFRALTPLAIQKGPVQFSFSDNGQRIDATAELIWTDSTGKTGGLSFASVPAPDRERLLSWMNRSALPATVDASAETAAPARGLPLQPLNPPPVPAPSVAATHFPAREFQGLSLPPPSAPHYKYSMFEEEEAEPEPESRGRFFGGFFAGLLIAAALAAVLFFLYGTEIGRIVAPWRTAAGLTPPPETAPPAVAPVTSPQPNAQTATPSAEDSQASAPESASAPATSSSPAPQSEAALPSQPNAPVPEKEPEKEDAPPVREEAKDKAAAPVTERPASVSPPTKGPDPGAAELAMAEPYLNSSNGPTGKAVGARLLWDAVEKGNVTAQVRLGDLYARGDGVTKNCEQARVLYRAAAQKGSKEGSQKLSQVIRTGC